MLNEKFMNLNENNDTFNKNYKLPNPGFHLTYKYKLSTYMFGVGIFIFILSLIAILLSMSNPELVYHAIAVALLSFMYFAMLAMHISNK